MLNKDLINSPSIINDNCCLLETMKEKDIYNQQKNKVGMERVTRIYVLINDRSFETSIFRPIYTEKLTESLTQALNLKANMRTQVNVSGSVAWK
jgi:hypothetical protein